ncbi:hypothetical protein L195_g027113 [Trifolium pratense]|uniref:Uncharacterized protein n=1 Tax=Trifolium pratense TaxID=57577 RepID=A0A2K3KY82_TRIPR|nr:hypothetical protein L195_g027113 [Trifolium pratense]
MVEERRLATKVVIVAEEKRLLEHKRLTEEISCRSCIYRGKDESGIKEEKRMVEERRLTTKVVIVAEEKRLLEEKRLTEEISCRSCTYRGRDESEKLDAPPPHDRKDLKNDDGHNDNIEGDLNKGGAEGQRHFSHHHRRPLHGEEEGVWM